MDPLTALHIAKARMAERHDEAARERLFKVARAASTDDDHEIDVWRRWIQRRLASRVTLTGTTG
jgi:hypothetical protein